MRRHDLMRATPDTWETMLADYPFVADTPLMRDWARDGRPFIVRRLMAGEAADRVPAAVPLPPSLGKRRLAFGFGPGTGLIPCPPVHLDAVEAVLPPAWHAMARALARLDDGRPPRVFGAVLWQHLTGLPYLSATSDLDLLWAPSDLKRMEALVDALAGLDADAPVRLDGEIELPDGGGVNWRELAETRSRPSAEVLVKTMRGLVMRRRSDLFRDASQ